MIAVTRSLRRIAFAIGTLALACGQPAGAKTLAASANSGNSGGPHYDWSHFGRDAQRTSAPAVDVGMTPARIKTLKRQQVRLDGTVDASAIYLHGVTVRGEMRDAFFVATTYGKSIAVDADHGTMGIHSSERRLRRWLFVDATNHQKQSSSSTTIDITEPVRVYV